MVTPEERRLIAPGTAVGVTEAMVHALVHAFYARVRRDPALGPIFNRTIADWDHHLEKLCDFWSSVTLMTGRFKGAPMAAHARLPDIRATHFARWLHLFRETTAETCPPAAAALFVAKAEMIGQSLQLGIAASRSEPPARPSGSRTLTTPHFDNEGGVTAMAPPGAVQPYNRTAVFTEATVPAALRRSHATKEGAWGMIQVLDGRLAYRITDPRRPRSERILTRDGEPGVVEPTILHEVEPLGPVRFFVEFHHQDPANGSRRP